MTEPMTFDYAAFNSGSDNLNTRSGKAASDLTSGVTSNLAPPAASSPVGNMISMLTGQLQGGLAQTGPSLSLEGTTTNTKTHNALAAIDAQDQTNSAKFTNGSPTAPSASNPGAAGAAADAGTQAGDAAGVAGDAAGAAGDAAAEAAGAAGELDPDSIDQEARDRAEQMLSGEQMTQQIGQMAGQAAQAASQAGQQLSQQFNQVGQQLGQGLQQAGQQLGQLVGKATQGLGGSIATPDLGLDSLGGAADLGGGVPDLGGAGGGIPDFGGGGAGDFGGGGGIGDVGGIGDGLGGDSAAGPGMTTSPALMPSPLTPPGGGSQNNSVTRVPMAAPMMPMMPMAARGAQGDNDNGTKRDPVIFAERPLYEPPEAVEQVIGARPEIESEEPPFGTGTEAAAN